MMMMTDSVTTVMKMMMVMMVMVIMMKFKLASKVRTKNVLPSPYTESVFGRALGLVY